jgi:hypothetical protein
MYSGLSRVVYHLILYFFFLYSSRLVLPRPDMIMNNAMHVISALHDLTNSLKYVMLMVFGTQENCLQRKRKGDWLWLYSMVHGTCQCGIFFLPY